MSVTRRRIIGVMGSGEDDHRSLATPLGRWIAAEGFDLLTGAGRGVMAAVAKAFVATPGRRGISIGIVPGRPEDGRYLPKDGYPNAWIELPIYTHLPLSGTQGTEPMSRNHINILTATALIILPGGPGTLSEASLAVGYARPAVLHGPTGAFAQFPPELVRMERLAEVKDWIELTLR
jgi:uncharacterized protein (TIGR00725 family)